MGTSGKSEADLIRQVIIIVSGDPLDPKSHPESLVGKMEAGVRRMGYIEAEAKEQAETMRREVKEAKDHVMLGHNALEKRIAELEANTFGWDKVFTWIRRWWWRLLVAVLFALLGWERGSAAVRDILLGA